MALPIQRGSRSKGAFDFRDTGHVLRLFGYLILAVLLLTSTIGAQTQHFGRLLLLPMVVAWLFIEPRFYHSMRYHWGNQARKDLVFLIDSLFCAFFIAAMQSAVSPTFVICFAMVLTAMLLRISIPFAICAPLIGLMGFYFANYWIFANTHYLIQASMELRLVSIVSLSLFCGLILYMQQRQLSRAREQHRADQQAMQQVQQVNQQLGRFLPSQLWQMIQAGNHQARIEYQRRKLTIFFSDIQGFTDLSEQLIPDDLAFLLNDYLRHMTEIAKQYGGTIDKFMGDGILIFFGSPSSLGVQQDALQAVQMAVAMRQKMRVLRERWMRMGFKDLHIRMGLSTGYCHVGNYGTSHRMSYTIVGRDVNLAARLQAAAGVDQILIADSTFRVVREHYLCVRTQPLTLKGIWEPIQAWQILERFDEDGSDLQRYYDVEHKGFHLIMNMDQAPRYTYDQLINTLQGTIDRLKLQQSLTDEDGAVPLQPANIVSASDRTPDGPDAQNTSSR